MRRALSRLADETFDVLVIGGGITGACIARDAARRGLKTALIDKQDFAAATSAHNSKLIHGGLRYLRNFELGLVRESLRERRVWLGIAPHLVEPLPFLLPVMKQGWRTRAVLDAGLSVYDALAGRHDILPRHSWLPGSEAVAREAVLAQAHVEGAFLYYDAQMYSPERLALECLIDADAHGAAVANYVAAERLLLRGDAIAGAAVRDALSGAPFDIRSRQTIVAAGPWSDLLLAKLLGQPAARRLKRSKGIHVLVPARSKAALTVAAEGSHFFVLPWRGHTLLGTTDTPFEGDPDHVEAEPRDVEQLLSFINRQLPAMRLRQDEVLTAYAGLRPLIDRGGAGTYGLSRRSEIHQDAPGLMSVIGGKWTTARALAENTVDAMVRAGGLKAEACSTATAVLPGGSFTAFADLVKTLRTEFPDVPHPEHLAHLYGARARQVIAGEAGRTVGTAGDVAAQVVHAMHHEMAMTVDDVVLRRTGIGQLARPSQVVLAEVSQLMGRLVATP